MFKPRFAGMVASGKKCQTVRPMPKRLPKAGDRISLRTWTGAPYRSKQKILREDVITQVRSIKITDDAKLWLDGREQHWTMLPFFAWADGFSSADEMLEWFRSEHGLPFEGIVIYWRGVDV